MFADICTGLISILTPETIGAVALGIFTGLMFGAIPGISGIMAISILLPLTFYVSPLVGIPMLLGIYKATMFGGSITAVLLNTPGAPPAVCTAMDGYPLTKQGKAGKGLNAALVGSVFGDTFSNILLICVAAPLSYLTLKVGPVEQCSLILLALTVVGSISGSSILKGILCARGTGEMLLAFPEVFFVILPELAPMRGFDTRRPQNHCWDVWGHTAHAVAAIAPESVKVVVKSLHGGMPYVAPTDMPAYKAAEKAVEATFGKKPLPFYSGGSIPIISGFESILGIKSLLIGFGLAEDAIHSPNESYGLEQFDKGVETIPLFYKYFAESE